MRAQTDTRTRIQQIALRLFTEQGYEATSLRQIAEELGVTKAALYYHFKTKEDIVASLTEDRLESLERLIAWLEERPRTPEVRQECIRRYAEEVFHGRHHLVMRLLERNQAALGGLRRVDALRERMLHLIGLLSDPADPPVVRLRRSMALFAIHASWFLPPGDTLSEEERHQAGIDVALELIGDK